MARILPIKAPHLKLKEITDELRKDVESDIEIYEYLFGLCESPVEAMFYVAWLDSVGCKPSWEGAGEEFYLSTMRLDLRGETSYVDIRLIPQKQVDAYRLDFAVHIHTSQSVVCKFAVEIDGHNFHEKTQEQATRDKSRDRHLARLGYTVLRYTGSEIYRNPRFAVFEVQELIDEAIALWQTTTQRISAGESTAASTVDSSAGAA